MSRKVPIIVAFAALGLGSCVRLNAEHCGNLDGDVTCAQRDGQTPFCSVCVADNDGCVVQAPPRGCTVGEDEASSAGTGSTQGTEASGTQGSTEDDTSSRDPTGETPDPCGNGTVDPGEECDGTDVGGQDCGSLGLGGGDVSCMDTCFFDTSACTNMPECGNGVPETGEMCDTDETFACEEANPAAYAGGDVVCEDCMFSYADCLACLQPMATCNPDSDTCCQGTACECLLPDVDCRCR